MSHKARKTEAYLDFCALVDGLWRENSALDANCLSIKLQVPAIQDLLRLFPSNTERGREARRGGREMERGRETRGRGEGGQRGEGREGDKREGRRGTEGRREGGRETKGRGEGRRGTEGRREGGREKVKEVTRHI